jgi:hypothetical protein
MTERRYYFRIQSAGVFDFVRADTHADAKAIVADAYAPFLAELEWVNIESITESINYG